jgi:hypothetical protein
MRNTVPSPLSGLAGFAAALALGCGGSDLTLPGDGRAAELAVVTGNQQTGSPGQALPQPLVVRAIDAAKAPVNQVRIAFVVTAGGGSTTPDTATTDADGRASAQWTLGTSTGPQAVEARVVGSDPVRATFLGTASPGGGPGGPAATTTQITSANPSPSFPTQPVVVAFRVAAASGSPTGPVTISDGAESCSATAPSGQCSLVIATAGSKTLTARYAGSGTFAQSSGTAQHQVMRAGTSTNLSSSANPAKQDETVTFSVSVRSTFHTPSGTVQFVEGSCEAPTRTWGTETLSGAGRASFSTQDLSQGTHLMRACYVGNDTFAPSASDVLQQEVTKRGKD